MGDSMVLALTIISSATVSREFMAPKTGANGHYLPHNGGVSVLISILFISTCCSATGR